MLPTKDYPQLHVLFFCGAWLEGGKGSMSWTGCSQGPHKSYWVDLRNSRRPGASKGPIFHKGTLLWSKAEWRERTRAAIRRQLDVQGAPGSYVPIILCRTWGLETSSFSHLWGQNLPETGTPGGVRTFLLRGCPGMRTQMIWPGQAGTQMDKPRVVSLHFCCPFSPPRIQVWPPGQARPGQGHMMAPSQAPQQVQ